MNSVFNGTLANFLGVIYFEKVSREEKILP